MNPDIKNTTIMCNEGVRRRPREAVLIDAENLEEVTQYKHLKGLLTSSNGVGKEK